MKTKTFSLAVILIGLSLNPAWSREEKINLDQLPPAPQAAIKKLAGNNEIVSVEKDIEEEKEKGKDADEGEVRYEVHVKKENGKETVYILNSDGSLKATKVLMKIDEVPAPVAATIRKMARGEKIVAIKYLTKGQTTKYEAVVKNKNGKKMEIEVSESGKLIKTEESED